MAKTKDIVEPLAEEHPVDEPSVEEPSTSSKKRKSAALKEIEVDLKLPEPPSKKARRLLKKGKTLPEKPKSSDGEAEDDEGGEKGDKAKTKKERSPYGVWVGNLRFNTTKADLRKWLIESSGGTITDEVITRLHMPTTKPAAGAPKPATKAENRGFAYVDFATFEANVAAIALSETDLNGRKLLIKDSKNFDGRPKKVVTEDGDTEETGTGAAAEAAKKKSTSTKVFVGNLSFQVTEDDLRQQFEKCGKIRWIKVATFEDTGKCKGYGWVNFEEPEAAEWAVKGFVKIRETIDTLEDFMEEGETNGAAKNSDAEEDGSDEEKAKKEKRKKAAAEPPRIKTRKWWVNQLFGRPLKIELAEDDQTRYNKRFRGGGKRQNGAEGESGNAGGEERKPRFREKKDMHVANDISVARLTGAPVAHQGKKTTFD